MNHIEFGGEEIEKLSDENLISIVQIPEQFSDDMLNVFIGY
jgi:hypothetical protein